MERLNVGDIVQHFKRETLTDKNNSIYLYKILAFAENTETKERMVVYQALYGGYRDVNFGVYVRPYDMFMGLVDKKKYPDINQTYRFELYVPDKKTPEQTAAEFKEDAKRILNNVAEKASQVVLEANKTYRAICDDETELGQKAADLGRKTKSVITKVVKVGAEEARAVEKTIYRAVKQHITNMEKENIKNEVRPPVNNPPQSSEIDVNENVNSEDNETKNHENSK